MTVTSDDQIRLLTEQAHELVTQINRLNRDAGRQLVALTNRSRVNRRLIWITAGTILVDVALTASMALAGVSIIGNAKRIDAVTRRLDEAQTTNRQRVLCPLYTIFLQQRDQAQRAALKTDEQRREYDHAFAVIQEGYQALKCTPEVPAPKLTAP